MDRPIRQCVRTPSAALKAVLNHLAAMASSELSALGPELDLVAHDLGLASGELRAIATKGAGAAKEVACVLEVLGIDPHALGKRNPLVLRDLQWVCTVCENKRKCNRDLRAGTIAQNYSDYCPNASTLQALKLDRSPALDA